MQIELAEVKKTAECVRRAPIGMAFELENAKPENVSQCKVVFMRVNCVEDASDESYICLATGRSYVYDDLAEYVCEGRDPLYIKDRHFKVVRSEYA